MLTNTIAEVSATVVAKSSARRLEVGSILDTGQVGTSEIGGSTKEFGESVMDSRKDGFGKLAGSNGSVADLVDRKLLLPASRELALDAASELGVVLRVLLAVLHELGLPLLLLLRATFGNEPIDLFGCGRNSECFVGVEAKSLLQLDNIVLLQRFIFKSLSFVFSGSYIETLTRTVDAVSALLEGPVADDGAELDDGRLGLLFLRLDDGIVNPIEVANGTLELEPYREMLDTYVLPSLTVIVCQP